MTENLKTLSDRVWSILGEGEDVGEFFMGSTAEAVDDTLNVVIAVLDGSVDSLDGYEKYWNNQ